MALSVRRVKEVLKGVQSRKDELMRSVFEKCFISELVCLCENIAHTT